MEGLVSCRINPACAYSRKLQFRLLPSSTLRLRKSVSGFPLGIMKQPSSFNVTAASVQPIGGSKGSQSGNTVPSKGYLSLWCCLLDPGFWNHTIDCLFLKMIEILELWRNADAVCFDVDSTVCVDEGIDELAEFCGAGKAVAEWTARLA